MSAKFKIFLIVILSFFATVATGVYFSQRQSSTPLSQASDVQPQHIFTVTNSHQDEVNIERKKYNSIPIKEVNISLQGSDPAELALNAFDDIESTKGVRKVQVVYPTPNQALVTITQTKQIEDSVSTIKYRVELATFGRSLFVSSPRVWQIVWAGSQVKCSPGSSPKNQSTQACQQLPKAATSSQKLVN